MYAFSYLICRIFNSSPYKLKDYLSITIVVLYVHSILILMSLLRIEWTENLTNQEGVQQAENLIWSSR